LEGNKIAAYGTPVIIFGQYQFTKRRPWRMLNRNTKAMDISGDDLQSVYKEFLPTIFERQSKRDSILTVKSP
jgi:hypothetical protein